MARALLTRYPLFALLSRQQLDDWLAAGQEGDYAAGRDDLSGKLPRGVGLSGACRPGAYSPAVGTARDHSRDAAAGRRVRRVRPAAPGPQHRDLPYIRPRAAAVPATGTVAECSPGHEAGLEEPEELAPSPYPAAFLPRARVPGLHVGGVGIEVSRPSETGDLSGRADDPDDRPGGRHLARDRTGHCPSPLRAGCRGRWTLAQAIRSATVR